MLTDQIRFFLLTFLVINNNLWIGQLPTQLFAPLFLKIPLQVRSAHFIGGLFLLAGSFAQLFVSSTDWFKHILFIFINCSFGSLFLNEKNKFYHFIVSFLLILIFFSFMPNEYLKQDKIFTEYGFLPRASLFAQNPNELAAIFLMPVIVQILQRKNFSNFTFIVCLIGIVLSGSRVGFVTFVALQIFHESKIIPLLTAMVIFCLVALLVPEEFVQKILTIKLSDLSSNNRWIHYKQFFDFYLFNVYRDGVIPELGNLHNTFLALGARFGISGIVMSFVIAFSWLMLLLQKTLCAAWGQAYLLIVITIPLLFFDFVLSPYFGLWLTIIASSLNFQGQSRSV